MNALRVVYVAVAVAVHGSKAGTIGSHTTLSHNLHNNVGAHTVPVAAVSVSHHVPAASISHHVPAASISHNVPAASISHNVPAASISHHVPAASISHHVPAASISHNVPAASISHNVPAASISHHVPAATISHSKTVFSAPVAHVNKYSAPVAPIKSQYHTQDKHGQYSFGYNAGDSSRDETRDVYGNVRGSFSYIDSYGKVQKQDYIADAYGFRVAGTNLPVHITDVPPYRHRRSYATFPASTGPLGSLSHVGPLGHTSPVQGYPGLYGNGGPGGFSYSFRSVPSVIPYNSYAVPTYGSYH